MSETITLLLAFGLLISLLVNFIAVIVAWKTDKWNERLGHKRIVNNARRKVQHKKYRILAAHYDLLVEDFEKLERQPRVTKSANGVMTISEPFLNNVPLPNLKAGDIIVSERAIFPSRKRR